MLGDGADIAPRAGSAGNKTRPYFALDEFLDKAGFVVEPVSERQARLARQVYADFGKGSGHPAGLNFGDCLAYALATDLREPLLWKGDDFKHTGIRSAADD